MAAEGGSGEHVASLLGNGCHGAGIGSRFHPLAQGGIPFHFDQKGTQLCFGQWRCLVVVTSPCYSSGWVATGNDRRLKAPLASPTGTRSCDDQHHRPAR